MGEKVAGEKVVITGGSQVETAARILATLAIEGIYFSKEGLKQFLQNIGDLGEGEIHILVGIFGKNGERTRS